MLRIRADARAKNAATFTKLIKRVATEADKQYRQKVFYMFKDLLNVSPQYSGDFVSNWRLVVNGTEADYRVWPAKTGHGKWDLAESRVFQKGDPDAVNFAFTRAKFVAFGINDKVRFVNATPLGLTGTTVTDAQAVTLNLRPVNLINGGQRLLSYMNAKYKR
jgi:hypothetical protein